MTSTGRPPGGGDSERPAARRQLDQMRDEIDLLHTISDVLGSVTRLEDAAARILSEIVRFTGARRASLWLHEPETDELVLAAAHGLAGSPVTRMPVGASNSVSATAFREGRTLRLESAEDLPPDAIDRFGANPEPWLAVPVTHTGSDGAVRTVGVLNLIGAAGEDEGRPGRQARLLTTLGRQVGSVIANVRLVEESLARERLLGELRLAQDLQMKLLPDLADFQDIAEIAGRCVPARPVGGDFYQLFRLREGRIGVMLGDVTSHGFAAALIMALSMSAAGIYAREAGSAGDLLRSIHRALIQKLERAEMFLTLFYGVIDPGAGTLVYANAGHAHAFRFHGEGEPERLMATGPPLGVAEYGAYEERTVPWQAGDLLCLFTDGLTTPELRSTEAALLEAVRAHRRRPAPEIVSALFDVLEERDAPAPDDRTALVVRM